MSARRCDWQGVIPPIVTPFREDGALDEAATRAVVDLLIEEGASGIIAAGSTGEWFALSDAERTRLFAIVQEQAAGRVPALAGTSAMGTREAVALTREAKRLGMAGCMLLPPPYALPTRREVIAHFAAVAAVGLPTLVYNNPARTGINIDARMAEELARIDAVVAFKESSKDLYQMSETLYAVGDRLAFFTGLEPYLTAAVERGALGTVSMIANVCCADVVDCCRHARAGRSADSARGQTVIDRVYHLLAACGAGNYVFVKEAMRALGRPGGHPRPPYLPMDEATRERMREGLARVPLIRV